MQKAQSNFVRPAGLAVLGVCALLSAYLGIGLLFAVLTAVFLVCLIAWLWTRTSLNKLEISLKDAELKCFPGSAARAAVMVRNGKVLPVVWLGISLDIEDGACVKRGEEAVFSWIMPWQKLSWHEEINALRRGVCTVKSAMASSGDGFGLSEILKPVVFSRPLRIVVFPQLFGVSVSLLISRLTEFELSKKGVYTDPTLLAGVREYHPGDSARDISWRLLARQGEVYVNVREKMDPRRMCLILDLKSFAGNTEDAEHAISLAASLAAELSEKGVFCSLALPSGLVIPDDIHSQPEMLLTALAELDAESPGDIPCGRMLAEAHRLGQFFCIAKSREAASLDERGLMGVPLWYIVSEGVEAQRTILEKELLK